jgi:coenzyme PQQ synthesis protein D (PqqD)
VIDDVDILTEPLLPSPDVVARRVAGEYLLVPVRSGAAQMDFIFTANEIGSAIFRMLDGARDGRGIARHLCHEFEVDEERARADVVEFLRALCEAGLARPARPEESR